MGEGGRGGSLQDPPSFLCWGFLFYFNKSSYHGCAKKREGKKKAHSHMTTSDSFFVYLPSNVNTEGQYPDNNAVHFTVPLADPLILSSKWETGLSKIFFPSYNYNIPHPLNTQVKVWFSIKDKCLHKFIAIPEGQYDVLEYTKAMNKEIRATKIQAQGGMDQISVPWKIKI